jgi:hypothetical protein
VQSKEGIVALSHFVPMRMRRCGVELRLILDGHIHRPAQVDPALLKALARARTWFDQVTSGRAGSLAEIARDAQRPDWLLGADWI